MTWIHSQNQSRIHLLKSPKPSEYGDPPNRRKLSYDLLSYQLLLLSPHVQTHDDVDVNGDEALASIGAYQHS